MLEKNESFKIKLVPTLIQTMVCWSCAYGDGRGSALGCAAGFPRGHRCVITFPGLN